MYTKEESHTNKCLECGDVIPYGRPDRKFCSLACKNHYNNRKYKDSRNAKLKIINALNKNYEILSDLIRIGLTEMGIPDMKHLGFNFDYMTSCWRVKGHIEYYCFDIKYLISESRIYAILKMNPAILVSGERGSFR